MLLREIKPLTEGQGYALISPEREKSIRAAYEDYFSGERGEWEADDYLNMVDKLYNHGGKIVRVVFLDSLDDLQVDKLGSHWTGASQDIEEIGNLLQWHGYGKGADAFYIYADIGPHQITVEHVDVEGNPYEYEIGLDTNAVLKNIVVKDWKFQPVAKIENGKLVKTAD